jgi:hypothetical protein
VQRYRKFNPVLREKFGEKVFRVGLCGGFTCPNRDGTRGKGGCIFCNTLSSNPLGWEEGMTLTEQLDNGADYVRYRHHAYKFIAFFRDYTSTYGFVEDLENMYREAISYPGVVGLALSTRPDCLSSEVVSVLEKLAKETFLMVEVGVQSAKEESLQFINRCHTVEESSAALARLKKAGIHSSVHVILGIPGEDMCDMLNTARFVIDSGASAVKLHNLHVVKSTKLEELYNSGGVKLLTLEEYVDTAIAFIEHLPPSIIIQRTTGEAPRDLTVAPKWSINKIKVVSTIIAEMDSRDTWQGRALGYSLDEMASSLIL